MVNAVRAAAAFLDRLPRSRLSPETTDGREGFLHPYTIEGGVAEVNDQDPAPRLRHRRAGRRRPSCCARPPREVVAEIPGCQIDVDSHASSIATWATAWPRSRGPSPTPRRPIAASAASRKLTIIRGGTDGSQLTELGLPTPNLSTGEHNPHSPLEWTCLEEMAHAVEVLVELVQVWGEKRWATTCTVILSAGCAFRQLRQFG